VSKSHRLEFDRIIDFIKGGNSLDGNVLREQVALLDNRRKQNLATHHSEFAKAIAYEGS
jgi:hypothetical protein